MPSPISEFDRHTALLDCLDSEIDTSSEIRTTPIFTSNVREHAGEIMSGDGDPFSQYGLLAGVTRDRDEKGAKSEKSSENMNAADPRVFYNIAAPSSVFICGSQGSGKSHTLACLLENCLIPSDANVLPRPLTGVVFHYDTFNSDTGGLPCEAAYLSTNDKIKVRVLCSPTNVRQITEIYAALPNVTVQELRIDQSQLNTTRMIDLMALNVDQGDGWPLYMHTVVRILRDMRLEQQYTFDEGFDYANFKRRLVDEGLVGSQLGPLQQRLDTLESFMVRSQVVSTSYSVNKSKKKNKPAQSGGTSSTRDMWAPKAGELTIVDLSCPCITAVTACSLFTICLGLFLEQDLEGGRVVALDEAHKYMTGSAESETLTESLLSAIRLQRHLAARIFVSTQEPTISPKLLDLCSVTIVHRFTSPEWLMSLKRHLAGASQLAVVQTTTGDPESDDEDRVQARSRKRGGDNLLAELFAKIVALHTGEALLFAPSATVGIRMKPVPEMAERHKPLASLFISSSDSDYESAIEQSTSSRTSSSANGKKLPRGEAVRLGNGVLKVRIRQRVTGDGGRSKMSE